MHRWRVLLFWVLAGLLGLGAVAIHGCGKSDETNPAGPGSPTPVNGNVNKAPLVGASVNIHRLNANGSIGSHVAGPFTTDASGNWNGQIPAGAAGPFVMVAAGGSYIDEATGANVTLAAGQEMYGILQGTSSQITPLTHATLLAVQSLVAGGATLSSAIAQATASSTSAFGFDFATTVPSDAASASVDQKAYAALLGGLSELIDANPALSAFAGTLPLDLIAALVEDMTDGKLDGKNAAGATIQVPTDPSGSATAPLPGLSAGDLSAWLAAANSYASAHANLGSVNFNTATVWNPGEPPSTGDFFSGSGTTHLPSTSFTPVESFIDGSQAGLGNRVWLDAAGIQIRVFPYPVDPTKATTASVLNPTGVPGRTWIAFNLSGLPGVSLAGGKATFNGSDSLKESVTGTTVVFINGMLDLPTDTLFPPSAPTGAFAAGTDLAITVSWSPVAGATAYNVYIAREAGVTADNYPSKVGGQAFLDVTSPFTTPTTLAPGVMHYAVVTAVNAAGEGTESSEVTATPTGSVNAGSVTFSGTGVALLGSAAFMPVSAGPGTAYSIINYWVDFASAGAVVKVVLGTGADSGKVTQAWVLDYNRTWREFGAPAVAGATYSSGVVTFTGCVLDESGGGTTMLTLDGSLNTVALDGALGMHGSVTISGNMAGSFPNAVFNPNAALFLDLGRDVNWRTALDGTALGFTVGFVSWAPNQVAITSPGFQTFQGNANSANGVTWNGASLTFDSTVVKLLFGTATQTVVLDGTLEY